MDTSLVKAMALAITQGGAHFFTVRIALVWHNNLGQLGGTS
jgi:hypothetical protein